MFNMTKMASLVGALTLTISSMSAAWAGQDPHANHPMTESTSDTPHAHHRMPDGEKVDPHAQHHTPENQAMEPRAYHHMNGSAKPIVSFEPLPVPTEQDMAAAFPDLDGMDLRTHMATPVMGTILVNQLEQRKVDNRELTSWQLNGWLGNDEHRLWLRSEGDRNQQGTQRAELHLLYGRPLGRWWEGGIGLRQDFKPGPSQSFLAVGLQGLAPYWFEVEATAYLGEFGQIEGRLEAGYELLLSNRLILQPLIELRASSESDRLRGTASGLNKLESGLRLRYEIRREFAPYIGVAWERSLGKAAEWARADGESVSEGSWLLGIRFWY